MIKPIARHAAPLMLVAFGASLSGCAYMNDWEEVDGVPFADFNQSDGTPDAIALAGPDQVIITEGDGLSITLEGSTEAGEALRFDRNGDRLTIARDKKVYDGSEKAIVRIEMPAPAGLTIAGSGEIESAAMASEADVDIAGSGAITIGALDADKVDIDVAGSGSITAAGSVERLSIDIAGSGDVRLGEVMADDVEIGIAGSGDVDLASNGMVNAEIAGSGQITVTGSATCSVETAGSGSLTCRPAEATAESEDAEDTASVE